MKNINETRRRFVAHFAGIALGSILLPGLLWGKMQESGAHKISLAMVKDSLKPAGVEIRESMSGTAFSIRDRRQLQFLRKSLASFSSVHAVCCRECWGDYEPAQRRPNTHFR